MLPIQKNIHAMAAITEDTKYKEKVKRLRLEIDVMRINIKDIEKSSKRRDKKNDEDSEATRATLRQILNLIQCTQQDFVSISNCVAGTTVLGETVEAISFDEITLPVTDVPCGFLSPIGDASHSEISERSDEECLTSPEKLAAQVISSFSSSNEDDNDDYVPVEAYVARLPPPASLASLESIHTMMEECVRERCVLEMDEPGNTIAGDEVSTMLTDYVCPLVANAVPDPLVDDIDTLPPLERSTTVYTNPTISAEDLILVVTTTPMNPFDCKSVWESFPPRSLAHRQTYMATFDRRAPIKKELLVNLIDIAVRSVSVCMGPNVLGRAVDLLNTIARDTVTSLVKYAMGRLLDARHCRIYLGLVEHHISLLIKLFMKSSTSNLKHLINFKEAYDRHAQLITSKWINMLGMLFDNHHIFDDYSMHVEIENAGKEILADRGIAVLQLPNYHEVIRNRLDRKGEFTYKRRSNKQRLSYLVKKKYI